MEDKFKVGDIVLSIAGRDSGKHYVVVETAENFVFICDGDLHKADKPKKKKVKHVRETQGASGYIASKLAEGAKVTNTELRRAVQEFEELNGQN